MLIISVQCLHLNIEFLCDCIYCYVASRRSSIMSGCDYLIIESFSEASYKISYKTNVQTISETWSKQIGSLTETKNILQGYVWNISWYHIRRPN